MKRTGYRAGCRGYCLSQKEHRARGVAAPRKQSIALSCDLCKTDFVTEVEYGAISRQIDMLSPRNTAPVHGDFISQVGRAYKMSATKGLKHAFQHESNASARRSRWQGLDVNCCSRHRTRGTIRPQAIDKSGKNSSKDNGRSTESRQGKLCAHSIGTVLDVVTDERPRAA